jgi:hypothetical protein
MIVAHRLSILDVIAMFKFSHELGLAEEAEPFQVFLAKIHWVHMISILNGVCDSSVRFLASNSYEFRLPKLCRFILLRAPAPVSDRRFVAVLEGTLST